MERALYIGSRGMLSVSALLMVFLSLRCDFWIYELLIFALLSMIGMTFTASNTLAMECERRNAGIASALLGATGFAFGGCIAIGKFRRYDDLYRNIVFSRFCLCLCMHPICTVTIRSTLRSAISLKVTMAFFPDKTLKGDLKSNATD